MAYSLFSLYLSVIEKLYIMEERKMRNFVERYLDAIVYILMTIDVLSV